jgi:hypothetical protein
MKAADWGVLILTFFTGVAVGFFVYFTGFRAIDEKITITPAKADFEITVSAYGGCAMLGTCPSYRLSSDQTYTFIAGGVSDEPVEPQTGILEKADVQTLTSLLANTDLKKQSQPLSADMCDSYIDGIDMTYVIDCKGVLYTLDTCTTAVDVDSSLVEYLDDFMEVFVQAI